LFAEGFDRVHHGLHRAIESAVGGDSHAQRCVLPVAAPQLLDEFILLLEGQERRHDLQQPLSDLEAHLDLARAPVGERLLGVLPFARTVLFLVVVKH
jgi:hypothetical protein